MRAQTLRQLEAIAAELEDDLARTQVLLKHIRSYEIQPEAVAAYIQRTAELETIACRLGLTPDTRKRADE